jgi:capsular polysaccharide biosynthesis protein
MNSKVRAVRQILRGALHGSPSRLCDHRSWRSEHPDTWRTAVEAEVLARSAPIRFGSRDAGFGESVDNAMPELGVLGLSNARILGPDGWLVTEDGSLLHESTWYGSSFSRHPRSIAYGRVLPLSGTCLSLASDFAGGNYGHFLLDCLGRLALFQKSGLSFEDVDYVYLPKPASETAAKLVCKLGIPMHKCVWAGEGDVQADLVIGTSFPGLRRNYAPWLTDFFRAQVATSPLRHHRRVYVPRKGQRKVTNEEELMPIVKKFGFKIYDFDDVEDEAAFFSECSIVVGPHGAGLTNLVFCSPGTKVLELIPSDHVHPYYYTIATSAGAEYFYIVGQSKGTRPQGTFGPSPFDFEVAPDIFEHALEAICQ